MKQKKILSKAVKIDQVAHWHCAVLRGHNQPVAQLPVTKNIKRIPASIPDKYILLWVNVVCPQLLWYTWTRPDRTRTKAEWIYLIPVIFHSREIIGVANNIINDCVHDSQWGNMNYTRTIKKWNSATIHLHMCFPSVKKGTIKKQVFW